MTVVTLVSILAVLLPAAVVVARGSAPRRASAVPIPVRPRNRRKGRA